MGIQTLGALSCKPCGREVEIETAVFVRDEPHCPECGIGEQAAAAHEDAEFIAAAKLRAALNECYQVGLSTPDIVRELAGFLHQEAGESNMCVPELLRGTAEGLKRVVHEVWEAPGYVEPAGVRTVLFGAVRKSNGEEFVLDNELNCLHDEVERAVAQRAARIPGYHAANPVQRIVRFDVIEMVQ